MVWTSLGGRRGANSATSDRMMGYGPVALHVAGTAEVRFRDVAIKDLNRKTEPASQVSSHFRMQQLNDFFYSWGATAGDINHDGVPDVIAGPFYYLGPDYTERHEFTAARSYSASNNFPEGMVYFAYDYTGDGWQDIICVDSRPIYLYVNPKAESRRWDRYNVVPSATSEIEVFRDIDGDGKPEILFAGPNAVMAYAKPDPANPTGVWKVHNISEPGLAGAHGMGVGDINGDGRMDVLNSRGWWEQPASGPGETLWKFHPAQFGSGGAEMGVYDVNGDGLNDVVTTIAAHGWGIAWFEHKRDAQGSISFVRHDIMGDLSTKNAGGVAFSAARRGVRRYGWRRRAGPDRRKKTLFPSGEPPGPRPLWPGRPLLVPDGSQSESRRRRRIRSGVDSQPFRRGLAVRGDGPQRRRRARHRDLQRERHICLLEPDARAISARAAEKLAT